MKLAPYSFFLIQLLIQTQLFLPAFDSRSRRINNKETLTKQELIKVGHAYVFDTNW